MRKKTKAQLATQQRKKDLIEWAKTIKDLDGNQCLVCGKTTGLQAHHLLPRCRWKDLELETLNGVALCRGHHQWLAHLDAIKWVSILNALRPNQLTWCLAQIMAKEANGH